MQALVAGWWLSSSIGPAAAQPPTTNDDQIATADRLFKEGRSLVKEGRAKEACQRFAQSDALEHTFGTAINLGECAERDGYLATAWQLYDDAAKTAERAGSRERAKFARDRATALVPMLCTIEVHVTDPRLAELKIMIGDRTLQPATEIATLVEPGEISVTISAAHTPPLHQTLTCPAGATSVVHFPESSPPIEPVTSLGPSAAMSMWKAMFGAGVAMAALSGAFAAYSHSKVDLPPPFPNTTLGLGDCGLDDAELMTRVSSSDLGKFRNSCAWNSRTNYAFVGVGIGAAVAVVGALMWYRGSKSEASGVALAPVIAPGQTGATLAFRW